MAPIPLYARLLPKTRSAQVRLENLAVGAGILTTNLADARVRGSMYRVTEDGEIRWTEDGYIRVTGG